MLSTWPKVGQLLFQDQKAPRLEPFWSTVSQSSVPPLERFESAALSDVQVHKMQLSAIYYSRMSIFEAEELEPTPRRLGPPVRRTGRATGYRDVPPSFSGSCWELLGVRTTCTCLHFQTGAYIYIYIYSIHLGTMHGPCARFLTYCKLHLAMC